MCGTTFTFTIESPPRTKKNSLRRLKRGGRVLSIPSAAYCTWHANAVSQAYEIKARLRAAGAVLPMTGRAVVKATFYQDANRRADECGYMQALGDWLQDVVILENDRQIHWGGVHLEVDRQHPRIEVEIRSVATGVER